MRRLGTVREIRRYPVKSMAGEALPTASLGLHGLDGDRRHAFRRLADTSDFPWLSASKLPSLVCHRPCTSPGGVRVVTPEGDDLACDGRELRERIAAAFGGPVELARLRHGIQDEAPLSIIAVATVRRVCEAGGVPFDPRRFRPNLLVDTEEDRPFVEDGWVGRSLRCGEHAVVAVTLRDLRCSMVNLDPDTARAEPRVLKASAELNAVYAGVYAVPLRAGAVGVGDGVYALD